MNTMMALWNRGWRGRLCVMLLVFISLCISVSLLVITAGSAWGALFVHRPQANVPASVIATNGLATTPTGALTPIIPSAQLTATATSVQVVVTNPCFVTTTGASPQPTPRASATRGGQPGGRPRDTPTPPHPRPRHTPTPGVSPTPARQPSPTPVVTPTAVITPTAAVTPVMTPTLVPTPTLTPSPGPTITPVLTPTVTATPVPTPTVTVTPGVTPTDTATPGASPTVTLSLSPTTSAMLTSTPTLVWTPIGPHSNGGDTLPGNSTSTGAANNCLGDILLAGSFSTLLLSLQLEAWVSLCASLAGTVIFCNLIAKRAKRTATIP